MFTERLCGSHEVKAMATKNLHSQKMRMTRMARNASENTYSDALEPYKAPQILIRCPRTLSGAVKAYKAY